MSLSPERRALYDENLTITLARHEWVKLCATATIRAERDPKMQAILDKLHPVVIAPLWPDEDGDVEIRRQSNG